MSNQGDGQLNRRAEAFGSKCVKVSVAAVAAFVCAGCAFRPQTTRMAVDQNDFVAQTTNRQTLLNVLRAREREPIHYTTFGPVSGTMRATGGAGLNPVINGDSGSLTTTNTGTTNRGATGDTTSTVATNTVTDVASRGA